MFNRSVVLVQPRQTEVVDRHVTHHHAPTDESVRLLREMEAKAKAEVERSIRVEDSLLKCVAQVWTDLYNMQRCFAVHFSINGRKMKVEHHADMDGKPEEIARALHEKIAGEIAAHVLHGVLRELEAGLR
jgi:hypothetical protein